MDDFDIFAPNDTPQQNQNPSAAPAAQSDLFGDDILGNVTTSTKSSSIDQFDFLGEDELSSGGTSAELPQASTVPSDVFSDGNLDQLGFSSTSNKQNDLFGEDVVGNPNPTTEETDPFGSENSDNVLASAPPPVVKQYDAFDDHGSNDPITTESTTKELDLFAESDSKTEAPVASAQSDAFDYDAFDKQSTAATEDPNASENDVLGARNSPSNVTVQDNIVEDRAELKESPSDPPRKVEEIQITNSEIASSTSSHEVTQDNLTALQLITKRREEELAAKDAEEHRRKAELRQQAKADLDRWYGERKRQMDQQRETMKHDEEVLRTSSLEKSTKESCDWGKVIRMLDFSPGTQLSKSKRDVTRMKACIVNAKRLNSSQNAANGV